MSLKELVNDWLEEGFCRFNSAPVEKVSHDNSLIPYLKNDEGQNITPRPLFPSYVIDVELDPNFLVEYFEVIENSLRLGKGNLKKSFGKDEHGKDGRPEKINDDTRNNFITQIEYQRKNIFLSKIVFPLFELPDILVPKTSPHYEKVLLKNEQYKNSLDLRFSRSDNFTDKSTLEGYTESESKAIETIPIVLEDKQCLVDNFHMKEHYNRKELITKTPLKNFKEFIESKTKFQNYKEFLSNASENPSFLKHLKESLYVMEKTLNYNTYKNTLLSYKNSGFNLSDTIQKELQNQVKETRPQMPISSHSDTQTVQVNLKHHLQFCFSSMKDNYAVSCIECNPKNSSIFASGYGVYSSKETSVRPRGMVLCWNIHKCEYPEKVYYTEEAVICVAFSQSQPFLLAAGMKYGLIEVYDLRTSYQYSQVSNRSAKNRPTGIITGMNWRTKNHSLRKDSETLLAVSTDGTITTWIPGKTLKGDVLKTVKRGISGSHPESQRKQFLLATDASGTCLQISPEDSNVFLIGTLEGQVLQANFDSPEEYSNVYECHNGPTYYLQWSPIVEGIFATCGGDHRVRIWEVGQTRCSKTIYFQEAVSRLVLSQTKSTLFVVLTKSGLLLFDFSVHMHKPVVELKSKEFRFFTCVVFCPRKNWILVGDSGGGVDLYEITGVSELQLNQSDALKNTFLPEY